jgi:Uma2 family endonuclease
MRAPHGRHEDVRLRRISVEEYHRMGSAGIFGPDERVELLNGRIVETAPTGTLHAHVVTALADALHNAFRDRAVIRTQQPLTLDTWSEPRPDIVLACGPMDRYHSAHPAAADALLVIEVARATLPFDHGEKCTAYACAGIGEYWIVNLVDQVVERFTEPAGATFRARSTARPGERIAARVFPDDAIAVDLIFGSAVS